MRVMVDPDLDWPLHVQLVRQLQAAIEDGEYELGEKLPSVRAWAALLRVNANTVVRAYTTLEQMGYVRSEAGRGYFAKTPVRPTVTPAVQALLQDTLDRVQRLGVDPVSFAYALLPRALRCQAGMNGTKSAPTVAVIECTAEQTAILAQDLTRALGVKAVPLTVHSLSAYDRSQLEAVSLFVTTYQHAAEVREALSGRVQDVVPCLLTAHLETLKALSRVPAGSRIGVGCVSWEGTARLRETVEQAGFTTFRIVEGSSETPTSLPGLLENTALIIAATHVAEVLKAFRPDAPVVVDDRTFTEGALAEIRAHLAGKAS